MTIVDSSVIWSTYSVATKIWQLSLHVNRWSESSGWLLVRAEFVHLCQMSHGQLRRPAGNSWQVAGGRGTYTRSSVAWPCLVFNNDSNTVLPIDAVTNPVESASCLF